MNPQGTCNGVQETTALKEIQPESQPNLERAPAIGFAAKRFAIASPTFSGTFSPLPLPQHRRGLSLLASCRRSDGSFLSSQHCQYLPFLFQTARVEVGRLVKED